MTIEAALKWSRLWWLLSLDLTFEFRLELWLDKLSQDSYDYIRSSINPATDLPIYGSDPRPKMYARLDSYEKRFGRKALDYLSWWERCVFIHDGDDRISEFLWKMAAYSQASSADNFSITEALKSVKRECSTENSLIEQKTRDLQLSKWDERAIVAQQLSLEEALSVIRAITSTNTFARSWHSNVTTMGIAALSELFAIMSGVPASAELQFDPETIPFPSSWEFDLFLYPLDLVNSG